MKTIASIISALIISLSLQAQVNQQVSIDREAGYPGGDQALIQYIYQNIKWPEQTKGQVVISDMTISLDVLPDSTVANLVVLKKVGFGIDEVVADMIKKQKFIPSIQNGTPVKMNIMLMIPIQVRN